MPDLNISQKTIYELFAELNNDKFVIPDYQRPYSWDEDKCTTLWNDLVGFYEEKEERGDDHTYFLGTIVTNNKVEIIDGQQRITSLALLLRAFYTQLVNSRNEEAKGLQSSIERCLFAVDALSGKADFEKIKIVSEVATDKNKEIFSNILKTGETADSNDLYTQNYNLFCKKSRGFAEKRTTDWGKFCVSILNACIILPIECHDFETALTIFSTLNDRGMPLSDSDIFKAQIYKTKKTREEKEVFIQNWKELTEKTEEAKIDLDKLFKYYTHIIRAKAGDTRKETGLRKFFAENYYEKFKDGKLIEDLFIIADFWVAVNNPKKNYTDKITFHSNKYLHCLANYPNEYWEYITTIFFYVNKDKKNFEEIFVKFLKKLTAFLFVRFIQEPTVNAIKDAIFKNNVAIYKDEIGVLDSLFNEQIKNKITFDENLSSNVENANSSRVARSLILLHAYLDESQNTLISKNFNLEHIFPKKWQETNYNGWNDEEAKSYLEKFGNKIAFEKKLNIQAGNGYFGRKKEKYKESKISIVKKQLAYYEKNDWNKEDIEKRDKQFVEDLMGFFKENLS